MEVIAYQWMKNNTEKGKQNERLPLMAKFARHLVYLADIHRVKWEGLKEKEGRAYLRRIHGLIFTKGEWKEFKKFIASKESGFTRRFGWQVWL